MKELHSPEQAALWLRSQVTGTLKTDSRQVRSGDGFIAWPGAGSDARAYVPAAILQGASACIVEKTGVENYQFSKESYSEALACYPQLKAASGPIAAAYFEQPSTQLDVLAVTGTNGKTSTAWWLAQALSHLSPARPCGLVGTLGVGRMVKAGTPLAGIISTGLTTPDPVLFHHTLRRFVDDGLQACAVEASSIGLQEHRLDGTHIRTAVFTNFTQDHLDYHGSMAQYWQAKAVLFEWPDLKAAVVNVDDEQGSMLAVKLASSSIDLWTVSMSGPARIQARDIELGRQGLRFAVCEGDESHVLETVLIGGFNVSNLLGVIAAMRTLDIALGDAVAACRGLRSVPGRMELVNGDEGIEAGVETPIVVVDYAHTPDALAKALQSLRPFAEQRGGQLWCIFGCGGDRDVLKRPLMGAVAAKEADRVVVTSDNPRHEKIQVIISQILLGLEGDVKVNVQADRAQAIAQTMAAANANDVVLIAGKGHEEEQDVAGVRHPFSDRLHAQLALQRRVDSQPGARP
jgi:UDP-N-acetylmuramoyl-L-alanyl-D-glutamate--2,6-diaminopimelate ligase